MIEISYTIYHLFHSYIDKFFVIIIQQMLFYVNLYISRSCYVIHLGSTSFHSPTFVKYICISTISTNICIDIIIPRLH